MSTTSEVQRANTENNQKICAAEVEVRDAKKMGSFGLLEVEQGVYHLPVDRVIEKMVGGSKLYKYA